MHIYIYKCICSKTACTVAVAYSTTVLKKHINDYIIYLYIHIYKYSCSNTACTVAVAYSTTVFNIYNIYINDYIIYIYTYIQVYL
jgi:hypothetical protein